MAGIADLQKTDMWTGQIMAETGQSVLRHILESPFPKAMLMSDGSSSTDEANFDKIQGAYNACMNETEIQSKGVDPLLEILYTVKDLYPAEYSEDKPIESMEAAEYLQRKPSDSDEVHLTRTLGYLMSLGADALISLGVTVGKHQTFHVNYS